MAIVPDLNGTPPGRAGNQVGVDPHNMSKEEYENQNDGTRKDVSIGALVIGNNQVLAGDGTRGVIIVSNPAGNTDVAISLQALTSAKSAGARPVAAGTTLTMKGPLARGQVFCWSSSVQALTILVG